MNAEVKARLSLSECIAKIEGYHDYPECRGNASVQLGKETWFLALAEGSSGDGGIKPTFRQLLESEFAAVVDYEITDSDLEQFDLDSEIEDWQLNKDFLYAAIEICEKEEEAYDAMHLRCRIDHILEQCEGGKIYREYPRDFANEFNLEFVPAGEEYDGEGEEVSPETARGILESWLNDKDHYGDLLSEFDTYDPWN